MHTLDLHELTAHFDAYFFVQIATVIFCGGVIGLERQVHKKSAGVRTSMLVMLGTMLFVKYSILVSDTSAAADPSRVLGQVVTGIGFLGAGSIMNKDGLVAGMTTASTIWTQAAIGAIIALGYLADAVVYSFVTIGILWIFTKIEVFLRISKFKDKQRIREGTL